MVATLDGAYRESLDLLRGAPSLAEAYFCANDIIALGFMRALREMGLSVPGDVSIVGFDNLPMAGVFDPPLTTIDVPKTRIGAMAIRLLDDLIAGEDSAQPTVKVLMTGELVSRDSVGDKKD